jgi:outer membrane lipoprotein SlyB
MSLDTDNGLGSEAAGISGKYNRLAAVLTPLMLLLVAGCAPDYSPNTYSSNAVQLANKVEPGVIIGFREVEISASGTVGAVTGGAAGGILGSQVGTFGYNAALGSVAGGAVGGLIGSTIVRVASDTTGWEYIVRKPNGDLLSVTQREPQPIPVGQAVLVITGPQARIVPDYAAATGHAAATTEAPPATPPLRQPPTLVIAPPPVIAASIAAPSLPPAPDVVPIAIAPTAEAAPVPPPQDMAPVMPVSLAAPSEPAAPETTPTAPPSP